MKLSLFIPLVIFIILLSIFLFKLTDSKSPQKSRMVGTQIEDFMLPPLYDGQPELSTKELRGQYYLLNVFASWCLSCAIEHEDLKEFSAKVDIYGINWKDEKSNAKAWLEKHGNIYKNIGWDYKSQAVLNLGVSGAPESFLIDPYGKIIFHQPGILTKEVFEQNILPNIKLD